MEELENTSASSSSSSFLPIALACLAAALGGAALFLAINAANKAGAVSEDITARMDKIAASSLELKKASDRIDSLALQIETLKSGNNSKVDALTNNIQKAVTALSSEISANRKLIEANQNNILELANRSAKPAAPAPAASSAAAPSASAPEAAKPEALPEGTVIHTVKSGDTFSKIAKQHKVTISSIEKANPGVDSSRLQIGQEIKIVK